MLNINIIFQLHDRLAALPSYTFHKKAINVCVRPDLSDVTENAESEYNLNSTNSTLKLRSGGYCHRKRYINDSKNSQSDGDLTRNIDTIHEEIINHSQTPKCSQSDVEDVMCKRDKSTDDRANNSLFVATIGSTDASVINATLERIPKDKNVNTDNLIELLVQEALHAKDNEAEVSGSGMNTGNDLGEHSDAIENTPFADVHNTLQRKLKERMVVSKSTSDESNTEAINDIPLTYVSIRKRSLHKKSIVINEEVVAPESPTYDVQAVEDFFSQHFSENRTGDLMISPTLAKKINVSSSETSEDFAQGLVCNDNMNMNIDEIQDLDIIECLNSIVDKVCNEFARCTEYLERAVDNSAIFNFNDRVKEKEYIMPLRTIEKTELSTKVNEQEVAPKKSQAKVKGNKLRYSMKKPRPKPKKTTKNKLPLEPVPKMSTIVEVNTETDVSIIKNNTDNKNINDSSDIKNNVDNSFIRRKRKLYSPKNYIMCVENKEPEEQENRNDDFRKSDDGTVMAHFNKDNTNAAMCYRELEKERQKYKRATRRSRCKYDAVSPKTKKQNDVFDNLKETIESGEKIMLADKKSAKDLAIYNYTSESDDEDFKLKKNQLQKRTSTTTVASGNSNFSTRRGRAVNKVNYIEDGRESSTDTNKKPNTKRKNTTKRNTRSKKIIKRELIDETMRNTVPKALETSFIVEKDCRNKECESLIPVINVPEFETIPENSLVTVHKEIAKSDVERSMPIEKSKSMKQKKSKKIRLAIKNETHIDNANEVVKLISDKEDDRTVSPLPGLLVETVEDRTNLNDSLPSNMVQKLKRIYHEGGLLAFNETNVTNTTQNLLSDNDRVSPQMNITEEFNKIQGEALEGDIAAKYSGISQNINTIEILTTIDVEDKQRTDDNESSRKSKRSLRLKSRIPSLTNISVQEDNDGKSNLKTKLRIGNLDDNLKTIVRTKEIPSERESHKNNHINDRSTTRNSNSKEQNRQNETFSISDVTEKKSEKSIATIGITAHGDFDELPPCSKSLKIRHLPREIVDLDASMKEYYVKLHHQVNLSNTNSSKSKENCDTKNKNCDEISVKTSTPQKKDNIQRQKPKMWLRSQKNTSSSDENSVIVSVPRMSLNEISKWMPSRRNSATDHEDSVPNLSNDDLRKWLPSPRSSDTELSKKSRVKLLVKRPIKNVEKDKCTIQNTKRKSTISPIKLFDELSTNTKYDARNSTKNDTLTSRNTNDTARRQDTSVKPYTTTSISKESKEPVSKLKQSTSLKRKGVTLKYYGKERNTGIPKDVDVSSGPSRSSVDDWFKRNTIAVEQGK